jgi:hypothetical protein
MSLPIPSKPASLGEFVLSSTNFTCDLPSVSNSGAEGGSLTTFIEQVTGLDGGFRTRNTSLNSVTLTVSGFMFDASTVVDFKRVVGERSVTLTRRNLRLVGEVSSYSIKEEKTNKVWSFSVTVDSVNGWWEGDVGLFAGGTLVGSSVTLTPVNDSHVSAPARYVFTADSMQLDYVEFEFDGVVIRYDDYVGAEEQLIVDCAATTATLDGLQVLNNMSESFFLAPHLIKPGANSVVVRSSGPFEVSVSFVKRYL